MNSTVTAGPPVRSRLALIVAGIFALFGSSLVTAPAQAGYYDASYPCSYRCGYPAYRYYQPYRPVYRHRCYSCGPRLIYERRYIERQFVERRYGYGGGYRRHYGYSPYGYRRNYGYAPYGSYRSSSRPATATVTAVSGAAGHCRMSKDTNGPDIPDMTTSRDRRRRSRTSGDYY